MASSSEPFIPSFWWSGSRGIKLQGIYNTTIQHFIVKENSISRAYYNIVYDVCFITFQKSLTLFSHMIGYIFLENLCEMAFMYICKHCHINDSGKKESNYYLTQFTTWPHISCHSCIN